MSAETGKKFGLIGKNISYSFSRKYFEQKFQKLFLKGYSYELLDLPEINAFPELIKSTEFSGLNVTIPYKTAVIPFLDSLSEEAREIGAVNCIQFREGKKIGHNTDAYGFEKSLKIHLNSGHQSALILGDGGAAKAVKYVLRKKNIPFTTVSRKGSLNFENLTKETVSENKLIIQATPVGTFPNVEDCVSFPFEGLSPEHFILDLIYNPGETQFLKNAAKMGAKTLNGYYMLEQQAEKAWKIWINQEK